MATLAATAVRAGKVGVDEVAAEGDRRDGRAAEEDGSLGGERGEGEHLRSWSVGDGRHTN